MPIASRKQEKHIIIETENKRHKMHLNEYSRWISLLEAIQHIDEMAFQKKVDLDHFEWIKPLSLQKYIEQREESIKAEIEKEEEGNFICSDIDSRVASGIHAHFANKQPKPFQEELPVSAID